MNSLVVFFAVIATAVAAPSQAKDEHTLEKRSFELWPSVVGPAIVSEPVVGTALVAGPTVYAGGAAVSHQSRVDVRTSPAVVAAEPVYTVPEVVVEPIARTVVGPAAVSHQSRVDIQSSPAFVSEQIVSPYYGARAYWQPSLYATAW